MAWRIIKQPNGKFARFSEVVDDFTHYDLTESEVIQLCRESYGLTLWEATTKLSNSIANPNRFNEEINTIELKHGKKQAKEREKELSANTDATIEGKMQ